MHIFLLGTGWPAAKWLWQKRELWPNWGNVWTPPSFMLTHWKRKQSLKRIFGCISCRFRTQLRVSKKDRTTSAHLILVPPLPSSGSSRPFICSLEGKSQVLEASSFASSTVLHRDTPSHCAAVHQGLGLVQEKAITWKGSWPSPSPSGYFWVIWGVAGVVRREQAHVQRTLSPATTEKLRKQPCQLPCLVHKRDLDSASHHWRPEAPGSGRCRGVSGKMRHLEMRKARLCMRVKQKEAEAFTGEMDGAASPKMWASN